MLKFIRKVDITMRILLSAQNEFKARLNWPKYFTSTASVRALMDSDWVAWKTNCRLQRGLRVEFVMRYWSAQSQTCLCLWFRDYNPCLQAFMNLTVHANLFRNRPSPASFFVCFVCLRSSMDLRSSWTSDFQRSSGVELYAFFRGDMSPLNFFGCWDSAMLVEAVVLF